MATFEQLIKALAEVNPLMTLGDALDALKDETFDSPKAEPVKPTPEPTYHGGSYNYGSCSSLTELIAYGENDSAVMHFIQNDKMIHAIKELRSLTKSGLKEAKDACEHIQKHGKLNLLGKVEKESKPVNFIPMPVTKSEHGQGIFILAELIEYAKKDEKFMALSNGGAKIEAIKYLRSAVGGTLVQCKAAWEEIFLGSVKAKPIEVNVQYEGYQSPYKTAGQYNPFKYNHLYEEYKDASYAYKDSYGNQYNNYGEEI